jgi:membrane protease YdiL (CAAX protease family)
MRGRLSDSEIFNSLQQVQKASIKSRARFKRKFSVFLVVWAVISGMLITVAGTVPWAVLIALNLKYRNDIPWAVVITAIYLWFYWRFVRGIGWPNQSSVYRAKSCRANELPSEVWSAAIFSGILGLWTLVAFQSAYSRIVAMPAYSTDELSGTPMLTLGLSLIMSAIVAGITEESGFRGYMQKPIEREFGPVVAILISGFFFAILHFTHKEVTIALIPFYMSVAAIYGTIAYLTNSILPGIVLHAGGNIFNAFIVFAAGRSEWQTSQTPSKLIWETGTDVSFWMVVGGFFILLATTVRAFALLASVTKELRATASGK